MDVEVHVRGAVEDLPLVRRALGSCNGRELRVMKVVPPPQPTSTSPLSFPTHPHLSPIPFDFYGSPSPSLNTALLHSPDKPHFPSPNPDETRLPSPDPDETRLLTIDAYTPELLFTYIATTKLYPLTFLITCLCNYTTVFSPSSSPSLFYSCCLSLSSSCS